MTHRFSRLARTAALLTVLGLMQAVLPAAHAQDGSDLLRRVQQTYTSAGSFEADFTQTISSSYGDESVDGRLRVSGDRFRVEAGGQRFMTDGTTTWLHNEATNQVIVNHFQADETTFAPSRFLTEASAKYRVVSAQDAGSGQTDLMLRPTDAAEFFDRVTLRVRRSDAAVTRIELSDLNGTTMRYTLRNVRMGERLPASAFRYTPPAGVEIVDLRRDG
jgi:outer membrane lipoprotein carrier protein